MPVMSQEVTHLCQSCHKKQQLVSFVDRYGDRTASPGAVSDGRWCGSTYRVCWPHPPGGGTCLAARLGRKPGKHLEKNM